MEAVTTLPEFPLDGSVKTLGWYVIDWVESMLCQPDGENAGGPYRMTPEQIRLVLWFYAVDDRGRFIYRRAVFRRSKGHGKSPFLGAICIAELCGPVRCVGFNRSADPKLVRFGSWSVMVAPGEPIPDQHPMPWVNLAGVSEVQTQNTMTVVLAMLENADATEDYGLDVGLTRIFTPGGGRLVPITASSSTQEGARPSFAVMDETHHWTESNGGWKLAQVIRRNLAKSRDGSARSIETTNAHAPGLDSVAEHSYQDYLAIKEGRTRSAGLLYDSREAPSHVDLSNDEQLIAGLRAAYGDATWVDLERIREEIYDPSTPPEESRRFYLNQIVAAADSWVTPGEWDLNENKELAPLEPGESITLGFDGSLTDDSTALVAVRVDDGAPFILGLWEKPSGPAGNLWQVDKSAVRGEVDHAFATYDVLAMHADVAYWETDVDAWRDEYGEKLPVKATTKHAIAWDMRTHRGETVRAVEALHRAIIDGECPHDGDARLRRHVLNARRRPNRWGIDFGKETRESTNKVDAVAALTLARLARSRVLASGAHRRRGGKVIVL